MTHPRIRPFRTTGASRNFSRTLFWAGCLVSGSLIAAASAVGQTITDGTYVSETLYPGGVAYSYSTPGGLNYTNGIQAQTGASRHQRKSR